MYKGQTYAMRREHAPLRVVDIDTKESWRGVCNSLKALKSRTRYGKAERNGCHHWVGF